MLAIAMLSPAAASCASTGSPAPHGLSGESAESEGVARHFLGDREGSASKAGPGYQWLTVGRLYWVTGPVDPDLLVAVLGGGRAPVRLSGDVAAIQGFVAMQFNGRLPGIGALSGIARLLKDAILGKGGTIATQDFFDSQIPYLGDWFDGDRQYDPTALFRLCSGIHASLDQNAWTLAFNVINVAGGVDVVRASGTAAPLTLQQVNVDVVKPQGTFNYQSNPEGHRVGAEIDRGDP